MSLQLLDFKNFDIIHNIIILKYNSLLIRGYSTNYPISDRPAFFTTEEHIARGYANEPNTQLGYFQTTSDLRLLDLRYMKILLRELFDNQPKNILQNSNVTECIYSISMALGICTYQKQFKLLQDRYADNLKDKNSIIYKSLLCMSEYLLQPGIHINPLEAQGIRVAETTNDSIVVLCLKEIFGDYVQGYISPDITTPFHIEKTNNLLNCEIVIFDPKLYNIKQINTPLPKLINVKLSVLYNNPIEFKYKTMKPLKIFMKGGKNLESVNPNKFFDIEDKKYEKIKKYTSKAMKKLKKPLYTKYNENNIIESNNKPHEIFQRNPTYKVTPWDYNAIMNDMPNQPLKIND